jgi:hypothetical protein
VGETLESDGERQKNRSITTALRSTSALRF